MPLRSFLPAAVSIRTACQAKTLCILPARRWQVPLARQLATPSIFLAKGSPRESFDELFRHDGVRLNVSSVQNVQKLRRRRPSNEPRSSKHTFGTSSIQSTLVGLNNQIRYPKRQRKALIDSSEREKKEEQEQTDPRYGEKEAIRPPESSGLSSSAERHVSGKVRAATREHLEKEMELIVQHSPSVRYIYSVLQEMVVARSIKPTASHYEKLILSQCQPGQGSIEPVKAALEEMEKEHIAIGSSIYMAVLKVLAIHPDHLFRADILERMRRQWISETPAEEHFVTAGYIQDGQLEVALENVKKIHARKQKVPLWLYTRLIYSLCEAEDFDAILQLFYYLEDERVDAPLLTQHQVLDSASECLHLDMTRHLWHKLVDPKYVIPSTGLCVNALLTAARAGDTKLAESVTQFRSYRQERPSSLERDLLAEAFVKAGDPQWYAAGQAQKALGRYYLVDKIAGEHVLGSTTRSVARGRVKESLSFFEPRRDGGGVEFTRRRLGRDDKDSPIGSSKS